MLAIIFAFTLTSCVNSPKGEAGFLQAVTSAFDRKDISQLNKLTCWDRVPEARRKAVLDKYARDLEFGAKEIQLIQPDPSAPDIEWRKDGITYRSNLKVVTHIKIEFKEGAKYKDGTYFVGEKNGRLFLLAPAPVIE